MKNSKLIIKASEIETMNGEEKVHFLNPNAVKISKSLDDVVGLKNIGVHILYVEPGKKTTEYHKHYYEEECIYILSGRGELVIGDDSFQFAEGDFVGFPTDTAAHSLLNNGTDTLICLVMGQRLEQDVADYPNQGKRLYRNSGHWDLVELQNTSDPRT